MRAFDVCLLIEIVLRFSTENDTTGDELRQAYKCIAFQFQVCQVILARGSVFSRTSVTWQPDLHPLLFAVNDRISWEKLL